MKKDYFPFLLSSKEGIFFVDTCAFTLNYRDPNFLDKRDFITSNQLIEETSRLSVLTNKLSKINNWLTIQGVIEEYREGTERLLNWQEKINHNPYFLSTLEKLIMQRKRTYKLLKQEHINTTENLTENLTEKIEDLTSKVKKILKKYERKPHKNDTDCKLISTALIYAEDITIGIFSQDNPLLMTFAHCAECLHLPINKTYILNEARGEKIPTKKYFKENN